MASKHSKAPDPTVETMPPEADGEGWEEILSIAGMDVLPGLEDGEQWHGIYLGSVVKFSRAFPDKSTGKPAPVDLFIMQSMDGSKLTGRWGGYALRETLSRATPGRETLVIGKPAKQLPGRHPSEKPMRVCAAKQRGGVRAGVPIVGNARAEADDVFKALGLTMDDATGEIVKHDSEGNEIARGTPDQIFPDLNS